MADFIDTILTFYYSEEEANFQSLTGEIKRIKDIDTLIKLSKNGEFEHFEFDPDKGHSFSLKKLGRNLQVDYFLIRLFEGERMRYDNYDKMLSFLKKCLQKTFSEFRLNHL
ncbi:MAG: hypothetical protein HC817_02000 [Saprospiraceae bacterium]|nr:hypothetical protein [Saprospiraceae bacterium]